MQRLLYDVHLISINQTIMKIKFIKASNWLLSLAIGAIGFSSCDENVDEYGTPSADYIISGMVTDSNDKPIKGIEVSASKSKSKSQDDDQIIFKDITDSEGNYRIEDLKAFPNASQYYVDFSDIDGEENGSFKAKTDSVKVSSGVHTNGSGYWYLGKTQMTLNTKLKKVETEK